MCTKEEELKPDYPKILFISVPVTFIFWFFCFFGLSYSTHNKNVSTYGTLILTGIFFALYLWLSIKYAKKIKSEVQQEVRQSDGIILLIFIIVVVALLAILGI